MEKIGKNYKNAQKSLQHSQESKFQAFQKDMSAK